MEPELQRLVFDHLQRQVSAVLNHHAAGLSHQPSFTNGHATLFPPRSGRHFGASHNGETPPVSGVYTPTAVTPSRGGIGTPNHNTTTVDELSAVLALIAEVGKTLDFASGGSSPTGASKNAPGFGVMPPTPSPKQQQQQQQPHAAALSSSSFDESSDPLTDKRRPSALRIERDNTVPDVSVGEETPRTGAARRFSALLIRSQSYRPPENSAALVGLLLDSSQAPRPDHMAASCSVVLGAEAVFSPKAVQFIAQNGGGFALFDKPFVEESGSDGDVAKWLNANYATDHSRKTTGFDVKLQRSNSILGSSRNSLTSVEPQAGSEQASSGISMYSDGASFLKSLRRDGSPAGFSNGAATSWSDENGTNAMNGSTSQVLQVETIYKRAQKRSYKAFCSRRRFLDALATNGIPELPNVNDPDFNIFPHYQQLGVRVAHVVALNVFLQYNFVWSLQFNIRKFVRFLKAVERRYRDENPYHNGCHAADVLQTTHVYLCAQNVKENFSDVELFSVLFAAFIHDVGHIGTSNAFLVHTSHPLTLLHNDNSPLENTHLMIAFSLMSRPDLNFFSSSQVWTDEHMRDFRKVVVEVVLGTDMTGHANLTNLVRAFLADGQISDEEVPQLLKAIVHAADLSNPMKPLPIYLEWVYRVLAEFWQQGDEEKRLGLEISMMCDRATANMARSQIGFISFVVRPFMSELSPVLPPIWMERLNANQAFMEGLNTGSTEVMQEHHLRIAKLAVPWVDPSRDVRRPCAWMMAVKSVAGIPDGPGVEASEPSSPRDSPKAASVRYATLGMNDRKQSIDDTRVLSPLKHAGAEPNSAADAAGPAPVALPAAAVTGGAERWDATRTKPVAPRLQEQHQTALMVFAESLITAITSEAAGSGGVAESGDYQRAETTNGIGGGDAVVGSSVPTPISFADRCVAWVEKVLTLQLAAEGAPGVPSASPVTPYIQVSTADPLRSPLVVSASPVYKTLAGDDSASASSPSVAAVVDATAWSLSGSLASAQPPNSLQLPPPPLPALPRNEHELQKLLADKAGCRALVERVIAVGGAGRRRLAPSRVRFTAESDPVASSTRGNGRGASPGRCPTPTPSSQENAMWETVRCLTSCWVRTYEAVHGSRKSPPPSARPQAVSAPATAAAVVPTPRTTQVPPLKLVGRRSSREDPVVDPHAAGAAAPLAGMRPASTDIAAAKPLRELLVGRPLASASAAPLPPGRVIPHASTPEPGLSYVPLVGLRRENRCYVAGTSPLLPVPHGGGGGASFHSRPGSSLTPEPGLTSGLGAVFARTAAGAGSVAMSYAARTKRLDWSQPSQHWRNGSPLTNGGGGGGGPSEANPLPSLARASPR